jgi:hypothetical protein
VVSARRVVVAIATIGVGGCGVIAGLPSDYQLADASTLDDASIGADAVATSDGGIATDATGDAHANGDAADASTLDASTGADSADARPTVPPSDPPNVACGATTCPIASKVCCEESGTTSCRDRFDPQCSGIIAGCDEAASCGFGQVCCVTDLQSAGLETRCATSCSGSDPQSCRTNAECPSGQTCVAWTCAGHTVATCNAAGADAGCN